MFAVDEEGQTVGVVEFRGATARDWEDMALAGGFMFAGDIGDNRASRDSIQVYRVPEPSGFDGANNPPRAERMDLRYPDGAHDAEALLVHPVTGEVAVITKAARGAAGLYTAKGFTEGRVTLERVASVPVSLATGAAVSPDGSSVIVRDYTDAYLFTLGGEGLATAFDRPPRRIDMPFAVQAEAVTFAADGQSLLTTHEGAGATVFSVPLSDRDAAPAATDGEAGEAPDKESSRAPLLAALAVAMIVLVIGIAWLRWRRTPH